MILFAYILGMMERMIEPDTRDRVQLDVQFGVDRLINDLEGAGIAGIGLDRASIEVSGELVEK